jgi:hypothetical protein
LLVELRGISPFLLVNRSAFHLLEHGFVVDIGWGPHGQGVPPSLGQFVYAVELVVEVNIFVFASLVRERTTRTVRK